MIGTTRPDGPNATGLALAALALALAALLIGAVTPGARASRAGRVSPNVRTPPEIGGCTMAMPSRHATIEAQIANAADFCQLVSQALADEVFRSAVVVTPGRFWHYPDAALSCRLRYRHTPGRMTIHNSAGACRWFSRTATGWRSAAASSAYLS
jgi:hypothetical protein